MYASSTTHDASATIEPAVAATLTPRERSREQNPAPIRPEPPQPGEMYGPTPWHHLATIAVH